MSTKSIYNEKSKSAYRVPSVAKICMAVIVFLFIGYSYAGAGMTNSWSTQDYDFYAGDFNGDGKTDLLYVSRNPSMPSGILLSDGNTPTTLGQSWASNYLGIPWSSGQYNVIIGDFNGDGKSDILLQATTPGDSYLLLTDSSGKISVINQTIPAQAMGMTWSSDRHHLVVGDFNGDGKADLYLQPTTPGDLSAIVYADANGQFTSLVPAQSWPDGYLGFNWSTADANVYAGDFNGDGRADLLIQAWPLNQGTVDGITSYYYLPYSNGVVLSQSGSVPFNGTGAQAWGRNSFGVDWSPLYNNLIIGDFNGDGRADVLLQPTVSSGSVYIVFGNASGSIFTTASNAVSANTDVSGSAVKLIVGQFAGGKTTGLLLQATLPSGTNAIVTKNITSGIKAIALALPTPTVAAQSLSSFSAISNATLMSTAATAATVSSVQLAATVTPSSAGRTAGQFSVTPTGAAAYNIPIWTPPGVREIEPHLALHYTSGSSDGPMGPGWSLTGVSMITRCGKTWVSSSGSPTSVSLSTSDDLCVDGNRLRLTSGTQGTAGSTYEPEIADFSKITAYGSQGNGPQYFIVQGKDGRYYEYGNTTDSRIFGSGATTPYAWALNKVRDRQNNAMTFTYSSATTATLSKIQYTTTANGAAPYEVHFSYVARTGGTTISKYVAGNQTTQPNQLDHITVQGPQYNQTGTLTGTGTLRVYQLAYQASPTTNRPVLSSIQECGGTTGSDCLRATTFSYQTGGAGVSFSSSANTGVTTSQYGYIPVDLNGDGIPDVLYGKSGTTRYWYARIADGAGGFGPEIATNVYTTPGAAQSVIAGSFAGNGKQQFLAPLNGYWYAYSYNGTSFTGTNTGRAVDTTVGTPAMVDWDGDGLPDMVSLYNGSVQINGTTYGGMIYVVRNTTTPGGPVTFASSYTVVYTAPVKTTTSAGSGFGAVADFNGDGRADLLLDTNACNVNGSSISCTYATYVLLSNGFSGMASVTTLSSSAQITGVPGDWNGDGCTDVLTPATIYVSNCKGGFTTLSTGAPNPGSPYVAMDWDGDGQTDLLYRNASTNTLWVIRSNGGTGTPTVTQTGAFAPTGRSFMVLDIDGDGQQDLGYTETAAPTYGAVVVYLHNNVAAPPDLLGTVSDGFGINFRPTYQPITKSSIYTKGSSAVWPYTDFQGAYYVVNQFSASNGSGGTYTNSFTYSGAQLNIQGRGLAGFGQTTQTDSRNNVINKKFFRLDFPYTGSMMEEDTLEPDNATYISRTLNTYGSSTLGAVTGINCSLCYFTYLQNSTAYTYEPTGSKKGGVNSSIANVYTQYTYDSFGSQTDTVATVTDTDSTSPVSPFNTQQWITETKNSITNDTGNWCLGRPYSSTTTKTVPGQAAQTRTVAHAIDYTQCRATSETVEPNDARLKVTTSFGFDSCGNTNSISVVGLDQNGANMTPRTTTTSYGTHCQVPETVTNALGQTTTTSYRYDFVVPYMKTDPNGISISWQYDDFARKTLETRPDGTYSTFVYNDCVSSSCWGVADLRFLVFEYLYNSSGTNLRYTQQFYDGLDRLRYSEGYSSTGVWTSSQIAYDSLGRKLTAWLPYSSSNNGYHQYAYDVANRQTQDTLYTNTSSAYRTIGITYAGMTISVTDPNGHVVTKVSDVAGKIRQVTDDSSNGTVAGTTKYTFDPFSNLIMVVDATGATSTYGYNIRGFKISSSDADSGSWKFTPDSLNELVSQTDAKSQTTTFGYDLLGRMTSRVESTESSTPITFTYGVTASAHDIGHLIHVTKPDGYKEDYLYDSAGRPQTVTYTEDGVSYPFTYAYNNSGTVDTLTYPVSTSGYQFALKNVYNSVGFLNQVKDNSAGTVFWTLNSTNDSNLPTLETLGNGVQIATGYTPWTNEMVSRTEGSSGSTTNLQNLSYTWDLVGNLSKRVDNRQSLTEQFSYDAMNRLLNSTLNSSTNLTLTYDAAGNIMTKSDVSASTYIYGDPAHKHAVTQAGSWSMTYDANGNMTNRAGGAISWYSYNLPNTINYSGNSAQFFYDANHQRWKQVANYSGVIETTHYIGGLLEVMSRGSQPTEYRHLIPGGSATISFTRRSDGTTSTYYATSDHLGSADLVMDSNATVLTRESFTPFGARRGSNWSGIPSSSDYSAFANTTRRGFTGHEMLDSVSLIHMNGRVYDPYLGRFISADSVIQNLAATQSVNPYSYAWNNPLKYVDPSGHSLLGEILGIIVAIVVIIATDGYAAFLAGDISFGAAVAAGFAGAFVSTLVSTGSLSAALMSGLIGAITAAAFYGVGTLAKMDNWGSLQVELAHAAVGCVSAAASGGNCGRGAAAAFLSEAANQSGYMEKPGDLASWGSVVGTAEAGLVGGAASEITGGSFSDGFSVGAAGYLFNTLGHSVASRKIVSGSYPWVADLLNDPAVQAADQKAWSDSTSGPWYDRNHETGFWIIRDPITGAISTEPMTVISSDATHLNVEPPDNPNTIASFHVHPISTGAGGQFEPSGADYNSSAKWGIPGIIRAPEGYITYGQTAPPRQDSVPLSSLCHCNG